MSIQGLLMLSDLFHKHQQALAEHLAHGGKQLLGVERLDQPTGRPCGFAFHLLVAQVTNL